jgi:four helix bundle protein
MAESILRIKSKKFAIDIIHACREMRKNKVEYALIDQLLRSGTSVGANIHEAQFAQGTKDFISKLEIALKECNECDYWLDTLLSTQSIDTLKSSMLSAECDEIRKILISSVNTLKSKQKTGTELK